jgi:peroxidase
MKISKSAAPSAVLGAIFVAYLCQTAGAQVVAAGEVRAVDGSGNQASGLGTAGSPFLRIADSAYGDMIETPGGDDRPNARDVSNALSRQGALPVYDPHGTTDWVWQWGQFIDHDITLAASGSEAFNIVVPAGDPVFSDGAIIPMNRTLYDTVVPGTSRQQLNQVTSFLDGSMIYGSDSARALELRSGTGGLLKVGGDNLLIRNTGGFANANDAHIVADADLFLGGDVRANEQVGLTAVHTLFVWEHNRIATQILGDSPGLSDEMVFEQARRIVTGEIQTITYNEFLPALMGSHAPTLGDAAYSAGTDPRIANEFSILYRLGHTLVSGDTLMVNNLGSVEAVVGLDGNFFNSPNLLTTASDVDKVLKGLASRVEQGLDGKIVPELQDMLFGPMPSALGLDLAALNIQRGRDHGLPGYNDIRDAYGLMPVGTVADITSDLDVQLALSSLYVDGMGIFDPNLIDPWIGALVEDEILGSMLGPLLTAAMADQFERLRDGDRFFFLYDTENLTEAERSLTMNRTLAGVIMDNTGITNIQPNVFLIPESSAAILMLIAGLGLWSPRRRRRG